MASDTKREGANAPAGTPDPETTEPRTRTGPEVIAAHLKTMSAAPGVYRMLDAAGEVIYVGKARNLKARVSNYARLGGHTNRIARMIMATAAMEIVTTRTESEALLLEANLIKRFRPRFNVLLRDDKSFPYILLTRDHAAPQILKHRGARARKGDYFGPFASAGAVTRTINVLQRAFLLRTCADSVYETRTRPCLLHQIKRCSGPCTGEIGLAEYGALVQEARRFLRGDSDGVRGELNRLMREASDALEFERAAVFRNRLQALSHVTADQNINPDGIEEADVFGAHQEGGQTCIQVFFFRAGQNWGNRAYFPRADRSLSTAEVLDAFIAQFYDDKPVPRLILLSDDIETRTLLAEALSSKAERKVEVRVPERGRKSALVEHAVTNAREALGRRLAEVSSQRRLLEGFAERFGFKEPPRRIEVYDNSHIQGADAVGAMVVAGPEGFVKSQYRKFNMRATDLVAGDDYAMMREMLTRRFKRLLDEADRREATTESAGRASEQAVAEVNAALNSAEDEAGNGEEVFPPPQAPEEGTGEGDASMNPLAEETDAAEDSDTEPLAADLPPWPDVVLIDGGPGQLTVAREVLQSLGVEDKVALIAVAKGPERDAGREHFHRPGLAKSMMLEPRDPVLYFVQRLRDEAHRFAIGSHRQKRSRSLGLNPLDEIGGIGPKRKRALLQHFGSAKAVSRASVEDLKAVEGISAQMAEAIYDFFHDTRR